MVTFDDLSWTAAVSLSHPENRLGELAEAVHRLEGAILSRLNTTIREDHRCGNPLLELLRNEPGEGWEAILRGCEAFRLEIVNAHAFRPSVRESRSLIARMWRTIQTTHPDRYSRLSRALRTALDLPAEPGGAWHESLSAVLGRPTQRDETDADRFARNVLTSVAASCQLITAAAHSDSYQSYPVVYLRALSRDLRQAISDADHIISALSPNE
jgi:hypothetical protein